MGERKSDTSEWVFFSLFPFPPSSFIFSWDVVVPAKYFPSLDGYVFPFFPCIPSTTTTAQHVEREGKCVKTLLHPPSLGFSSLHPGERGRRRNLAALSSNIRRRHRCVRLPPLTSHSHGGRETAAQGFFILATLLDPFAFNVAEKYLRKKRRRRPTSLFPKSVCYLLCCMFCSRWGYY